MSTARQAIRRRKQARIDKRYRAQKTGDAETSQRRLIAKVARERTRQMRASKKK